jgi:probable phosphoglycerate mutase
VEIVFIRHGQPEWTKDGLNVENPPLTDLGHCQAEAMANALASEDFDEVFCSPLVRARQTAAPLFEALGRPEQIAPWLKEIGDPAWHGTPAEKAQAAYREFAERPVDQRWEGLEGGESVRDFTARIRSGGAEFWSERGMVRTPMDLPVWKVAKPGTRIALVAHVGTNSVAIGHLLGLEPTPWEWERFVLGHASISRVEALPVHDGHMFSLSKLSDVEHIDAENRTR